jgi:hypothetical protein
MDTNQEINEQEPNEISSQGKAKQWLQDNLRILISVLIVVLIAGGIYSYSKRNEAPAIQESSEISTDLSDISEEEQAADQQKETASEQSQSASQDKTSSIATSQETEKSFIQTAAKGDGTTKLARAALANFLEKNADSGLTTEHKIYIEDYLRKHIAHKGSVNIGTSVEFSKDLIQEAISKSKTLNDNQLKNLHKYAVRVPSLS